MSGLPSVEEAMAYANGYSEGLRDAKEQDVATLINERDLTIANFAFEKAVRKMAERRRDETVITVVALTDELATERAAREKAEREIADWREACLENAGAWEYEKTRAEKAERERDALREAAIDALAALVAAHSLLSRSSKKAAPSDRMFDQMLADYKASIDRTRAALIAIRNERARTGAA